MKVQRDVRVEHPALAWTDMGETQYGHFHDAKGDLLLEAWRSGHEPMRDRGLLWKGAPQRTLAEYFALFAAFTHALTHAGLKEVYREEAFVNRHAYLTSFDEETLFPVHDPTAITRDPLFARGFQSLELLTPYAGVGLRTADDKGGSWTPSNGFVTAYSAQQLGEPLVELVERTIAVSALSHGDLQRIVRDAFRA